MAKNQKYRVCKRITHQVCKNGGVNLMLETERAFNPRNQEHTKLEVRYKLLKAAIPVQSGAENAAIEVINLANSIDNGHNVLLEIADNIRSRERKPNNHI